MIPTLAYVVLVLAGVSVVCGIVNKNADKPPGKAQLLFAAGLWPVTPVQSIVAGVQLAAGFSPQSPSTVLGYLIGIVLLIPVAWFWANSERTRYSGLVLAVAALAVLAMTLRLLTLWVPVA